VTAGVPAVTIPTRTRQASRLTAREPAGAAQVLTSERGGVSSDALYSSISLTPLARALIASAPMKRLKRVKQLTVAHWVFPGANHTRFEHSLGVWKLAQDALHYLVTTTEPALLPDANDVDAFALAALLHDIGHCGAGSHLLEELDYAGANHETTTIRLLHEPPISSLLRDRFPDGSGPRRIAAVLDGTAPLSPLLSSGLDIDKLDYLPRDGHACGVPYGNIDAPRLLHSLRWAPEDAGGPPTLALDIGGLIAFEHALMARRAMYGRVYYHPDVRSATAITQALWQRLVGQGTPIPATRSGLPWDDDEAREWVVHATTGVRLEYGTDVLRDCWLGQMPYTVAATVRGARVAQLRHASATTVTDMSDTLAAHWGQKSGTVLIDIPRKPAFLPLDVKIRRGDGQVVPVTSLQEECPLVTIPGQLGDTMAPIRVMTAHVTGSPCHRNIRRSADDIPMRARDEKSGLASAHGHCPKFTWTRYTLRASHNLSC